MTLRDRLFALEVFGIKLGLDNMRVLVEALGHPERGCATVHVAGTNGKGSVSAMVELGLRAAGFRTGLYTSPHLDRPEERIALDGEPIGEAGFDAAAARVFAAVDAARNDGRLSVTPTFFEVTTAMAFDAFRAASVEIAVIEVGLGGRFDATNVIVPRLTAITSIAFDHERHLGSTLAAIAGEKAGIAKPGVPLVSGPLPAEAAAVVEAAARTAGAPLQHAAGALTPTTFDRGHGRVRPHSARWPSLPETRLALPGRHQVDNAAIALRMLEVLDADGFTMPADAVQQALADVRWPARLEWLQLPAGAVLIDAAHNPAGAEALASYLVELGDGPLPVVLAAMQDKNVEAMVRPLARVASRFVATSVDSGRASSPDALAARIAAAAPGVPITVDANGDRAVIDALGDSRRAVAAGSIYFVGPLRARLIASGARPI